MPQLLLVAWNDHLEPYITWDKTRYQRTLRNIEKKKVDICEESEHEVHKIPRCKAEVKILVNCEYRDVRRRYKVGT